MLHAITAEAVLAMLMNLLKIQAQKYCSLKKYLRVLCVRNSSLPKDLLLLFAFCVNSNGRIGIKLY